MSSFSRIAIVNRGEPAMRLIHAVREWNAAGGSPLRTIALHTAVDRRAMFVREADEAVLIGPDDPDHLGPSPYLDHAELERALKVARADAVWPGWGFVSEKAEFAELCRDLGITFIGPSPEVMRDLGDKIAAKRLAERVGVPLAAWSGGPVADLAEAREKAETIGYPLMVKATAGGGGRGIRYVATPADLAEAFERAASEAGKTAGDATVFLERAVRGGRHVEVQVVADASGDVWTLGVRDCSVQRRNQKVIEESASTALDAEQEELLRTSAAELARAAGYVNAGTVEFLYEPKERLLSFLEVNTRLQVEHPVTEACTGVDIVKLQLHVAGGGKLADLAAKPPHGGAPEPPRGAGWAIEARLTAEDPERGFAPAPGLIEHLALPAGPGIRVDTGVATGDVIPPQFDSMIAKIIAWGRDRDEARARLVRALRQTAAVIDGGTTNKAFLIDLLQRPELVGGETDTTWLDGLMAQGYTPPRRLDVALLATAVEAHDGHVARQQERLFTAAERGRPEVGAETWHQTDVRAAGESYRLRVARTRANRYRVVLEVPGGAPQAVDVDVERSGRFERRLTVGDTTYSVLSAPQDTDYLVEVDGAVHRISGGEAGMVRAPAPAMVVAVPVTAGQEVAEGDVVAIVESMKLETALRAPFAGTVAEVLVPSNTQVEGGTKLVRLEPAADAEGPAAGGDRADFSALLGTGADTDPAAAAADVLTALRWQVLGYDVDERESRPLLARLDAARAALPGDDPAVLAGEKAVLRIFTDLSALSRNRRESDGEGPEGNGNGESGRNPQEYLHAYLRSRDAEAEQLPESFRAKLRRALAHYGVELDGDPQLEPALYWMFLAHRRATAHEPVILDLLQWRLAHPESLTGLPAASREEYLRTLDDLVLATQLRHPAVGDLARQVRYHSFDAPAVAAERERVQHEVREQLDHLAEHPDTPDRAERIEALVASSEPILGVFGARHNAALLEVMTRRYYRIRPLQDLRLTESVGLPVLTASYTHRGNDRTVLATVIDNNDPRRALAAANQMRRLVEELPEGRTALVDLYVTSTHADDRGDPDARADRVRAAIGAVAPGRVARVAVAVRPNPSASPDVLADPGPVWFTFRPEADGTLVEDRTLRGLHPLVAERLGLWRLGNFDLRRLPAEPDVHLFHATGKNVREDQRLLALSDVRRLTVLRDDAGVIRSLPELERAIDACLDSLRSARSRDPKLAKLSWNRILLYVWPVVDVPFEELDVVVRRLAARTGALGLEQVLVQFRAGRPGEAGSTEGGPHEYLLRLSRPPGAGLTVRLDEPPTGLMRELDAYAQNVIKAQRRGAVYPYEIIPMLTGPEGRFVEYDLVEGSGVDPVAEPVEREPGRNTANIVLGTVTAPTAKQPEGMTRVVLLGDPTRGLGALAEPECARVCAAIRLARELDVPVEWFAVSSGAKIAMDSGTENMDWISRALRAIIEFTQAGGEVNVVVTGINVGAQPYWNAEATMLLHTKGILVMTPDSAMVLTGKQSLDYSGGVSAEDNFGIGGYDRIMGPNGQAQYWAPDLAGAVDVLFRHYEHTYRVPGERFPRPAPTTDPVQRDVTTAPHEGGEFTTLGEIFSPETNPGRKKPFDIRSVMRGVADLDHAPLERWADMHDADSVVVFDAHLGGQPVSLLGIESKPIPRRGVLPVDGPEQFTAGTLFPRSSKKTARAINAASGNRPLVVLANLSGFDGSPESLRELQLEYGAEIGRAIVNFDGPIVFCVVSRYHGGAFVVFSATLNDKMEVAAVEGSYASVLGGAPAAAVVFAGEVRRRTNADERVTALEARIAAAVEAGSDAEASRLRTELAAVRAAVRSEKLGAVAEEFDSTHSIQRAQRVGSVHHIVDPHQLRPYLVDAVRRGIARTLEELET
ncbi:biotin carboxylase N-terminal domain-containing protein [Pseudonocardia lutea]|uniref:ATP-binding protein n=1 Tax=Pseudonocardia lutea TaxID=2172015 RepID=UPI003A986024